MKSAFELVKRDKQWNLYNITTFVGWNSLEERRGHYSLVMMYKIVHGLVVIQQHFSLLHTILVVIALNSSYHLLESMHSHTVIFLPQLCLEMAARQCSVWALCITGIVVVVVTGYKILGPTFITENLHMRLWLWLADLPLSLILSEETRDGWRNHRWIALRYRWISWSYLKASCLSNSWASCFMKFRRESMKPI